MWPTDLLDPNNIFDNVTTKHDPRVGAYKKSLKLLKKHPDEQLRGSQIIHLPDR